MRLDKWLKVARVIKRRTIANEVCDNGRITIDGRVAKAATEVKVGDQLVVQFGPRKLALTVLEVPAGAVAASRAAELYRITEAPAGGDPFADPDAIVPARPTTEAPAGGDPFADPDAIVPARPTHEKKGAGSRSGRPVRQR